MAYFEKKDYDKAIADFDRVIQIAPRDAEAFWRRGSARKMRKDSAGAIQDISEAIRLDPRAQVSRKRASAWSVLKEFDKAIVDVSDAIRLDPDRPSDYMNRGEQWFGKGEYEKAISDYGEAIRLDPKDAVAHFRRACAWSRKKEYDRAISDWSDAIRLESKDVSFRLGRGTVWILKKEFDNAIAEFDAAFKLDPDRNFPLLLQRSACLFLARRPGALKGCKALLDLAGWRGQASNYAVLMGYFAALRDGQPDEARDTTR